VQIAVAAPKEILDLVARFEVDAVKIGEATKARVWIKKEPAPAFQLRRPASSCKIPVEEFAVTIAPFRVINPPSHRGIVNGKELVRNFWQSL
jgi:hypothetical protein